MNLQTSVPRDFVLTLNAGSSSLKFAVFQIGSAVTPVASGQIDGLGRASASLKITSKSSGAKTERAFDATQIPDCLVAILDALSPVAKSGHIAAIGHRVVHGGPLYTEPQRVTPELLRELQRLSPLDPSHLPAEIALIEAAQSQFPALPQFACFDTSFHRDLPLVARLLAIPRRYEAKGIRRYGFHGLSYQFLMEELRRLGDPAATHGKIILAHLGNGASLAAVRDGKCVDTSMGFTPAAGLLMGTRTGDLDPGLAEYFARTEDMTATQFQHLVNHESGLLGISETSADLRELLAKENQDSRASDAVEMFCYQARKWIGAYSAALGGMDTLVFAGGIGENCPSVRARICSELDFIGVKLDESFNRANAAVISSPVSRVRVRMIHTDEELTIARTVAALFVAAAGNPN